MAVTFEPRPFESGELGVVEQFRNGHTAPAHIFFGRLERQRHDDTDQFPAERCPVVARFFHEDRFEHGGAAGVVDYRVDLPRVGPKSRCLAAGREIAGDDIVCESCGVANLFGGSWFLLCDETLQLGHSTATQLKRLEGGALALVACRGEKRAGAGIEDPGDGNEVSDVQRALAVQLLAQSAGVQMGASNNFCSCDPLVVHASCDCLDQTHRIRMCRR